MNPLNAKSPYYSDRNFRSKELQPTVGFASRESAIAYLNELLNDYRIQASYTPEQQQSLMRLLTEIALETIRQTGDSIDYRGISSYQAALQKSLSDQRTANYSGAVIQAWQQVISGYKATGKTAIDLGEFVAEPVLLSLRGEKPVTDWALEPTDSIGVVRCYDIAEEQYAKQTWREVNTNPNSQISVGHLRSFQWNLECFNRVPEQPVYRSFKQWVETHLSAFEKEHGSLTPVVCFKVSDVVKQTWGGSNFLVGWRITLKKTEEPQKGLLGKLLAKLPSV